MTLLCENVESFGNATSTVLGAQCTVVALSEARGVSSVIPQFLLPLTSTGHATNVVQDLVYANALSVGNAVSVVEASNHINSAMLSSANARSTPFVGVSFGVSNTAAAVSTVAYSVSYPIVLSSGVATSSVTVERVTTSAVASTGNASSSVVFGGLAAAVSTGNAVSSVISNRQLNAEFTNTADAVATVTASRLVRPDVLISTAVATSSLSAQLVLNVDLTSSADASSGLIYKDPDRVAWVLNTETAAAGWYSNYDFESIAQPPERVLAVGPDGLYELTGGTDAGELIDAAVVSGFSDFNDQHSKRMDAIYYGYTSVGRISVTVETYGSGHAPSVYYLEERDADAPRNSRIIPGKGLVGRYWRTTTANVDGAAFRIYDTTIDIATSMRRV
jgi:hypothetical protein